MKILTQIDGLIFEIPAEVPLDALLGTTDPPDSVLIPTEMIIGFGGVEKSLIDRMKYFILDSICNCDGSPMYCQDLRPGSQNYYRIMKISDLTLNYMLKIAK